MKFEENLREARKRIGYSQEELAAYLGVSRQSVSKWETSSAYPELDKLLSLCELFQCTVDDLLKGEIKEELACGKSIYEEHERAFRNFITTGVVMIIMSASAYCFMDLYFVGEREAILNMIFMLPITIAVLLFVYAGSKHSDFYKKYKQVPAYIYTQAEIDAFHSRYRIAIVVGVACILISTGMYTVLETYISGSVASGLFLLMISIAVGMFVYFGLMNSQYNKTIEHVIVDKQEDERVGKWCGAIMMLTFAIYLLWSFLGDAWRISWCLFPVGGVLCGVVSVLFSKEPVKEKR